jgi:FKBP-type peptidyl-prolyl cis-trans isomerase FkpA
MSVTTVPIHPIKKGSLTKIWLGVIAIAAFAAVLAYFGTEAAVIKGATNEQFLAANADEEGVVTTASGLQYMVIKPGEGPSPIVTDTALVKYEGRLRDGTVFDANEQAPMPVGAVVPGFSEALQLMQKGGEYRIWIPAELGYGSEDRMNPQTGEVSLPGDSLLIFDISLIDFISQAQMEELRQQMQQQGVGPRPPGQ